MWDTFSLLVAIRHLRYSIAQTLLTLGVVAISVTLIIFLASLIRGLQIRLIDTVTGSIPQIVISQGQRVPITPWLLPEPGAGSQLYKGRIPTLEEQKRTIEDWRMWVDRLENFDPRVTAVSPIASGQGILARGQNKASVLITGVIPERQNKVVNIESSLQKGRFIGLRPREVAIGYTIADDLGLRLGDKVRITSADGVSDSFTLRGIFRTGYPAVDASTAYVPLGDAQSLFKLQRAVTSIGIKLSDVFAANEIARRMRLQVPYDVESWMEENQALLSALQNQTQTTTLILLFTTIAASFGIASILITSVTSKLREIGILKAIGATQKQILGIFTLESTLMAALGGLIGVGLGVGLSIASYQYRLAMAPSDRKADVFPIDLSAGLILGAFGAAILVGFLASLYPAWRAARVNAIEVIRGT